VGCIVAVGSTVAVAEGGAVDVSVAVVESPVLVVRVGASDGSGLTPGLQAVINRPNVNPRLSVRFRRVFIVVSLLCSQCIRKTFSKYNDDSMGGRRVFHLNG
jgi:hypothetical protein